MNLDKSRTKIDLTKALGSQFADMGKEASRDQLRQEGARDALKFAAQRVGELGLHVVKDLEEGVLSPSDMKDPKLVEIFIKKYIKRATGVLDNLATTAEVARTIASGREKGIASAEEVVRRMCETEVKKLHEIERQLQTGEMTVEELRGGGHPGLPLKYQREDEEAAAAEGQKAEESEASSEVPAEPSVPSEFAPEPEGDPEPQPAKDAEPVGEQDKKRIAQKAMAAVARKRAKTKAGPKTRG